MSKVILGTTMSLDGFIADKNGSLSPLYPDFEAFHELESLQETIRTTGAVVMGRLAYAMGDPDDYADNYEFQVPIFILTHHPPDVMPKQNDRLTFTFVTDGVESAVTQAKAADGDRNVVIVGGASTAQQCLNTGLVDELEIDIRHILLGEGLRFFDHIENAPVELASSGVSESPGITHLKYRVIR